MTSHMSKRAIARIVTFATAILLLLFAVILIFGIRAKKAELALEYNYLKAIEDLSTSAENINTSLQKGLYSGTSNMMANISNDLLLDSAAAKASLSQLSASEQSLEGANKFLSQVGNYAVSLCEKLERGEKITDEEYNTLEKLCSYSEELKNKLWEIEQSVRGNGEELSYKTVSKLSDISEDDIKSDDGSAVQVGLNLGSIDKNSESYPTLIYDGPFSDHILEKQPEMIKNQNEVTKARAKKRAGEVSVVQEDTLKLVNSEDGKMPSYVFESNVNGEKTTVAVTKNGGYCSYMIRNRDVKDSNIANEEAVNYAKSYLDELGIYNVQSTYYETIGNVCTINFAYKENDVIYYTDLIKVKVAMDNGEILGFDARGFLTNHKTRQLSNAKVTEDQARKTISPRLTVEQVQKALIPSNGEVETLCYELKCKTKDNKEVLVYVNCETGEEEQILLLLKSETGNLTV